MIEFLTMKNVELQQQRHSRTTAVYSDDETSHATWSSGLQVSLRQNKLADELRSGTTV